jgi:ABC-2 type transport system permease protein
MPPSAYIIAKMFMTAVVALLVAIVVSAVALAAGKVSLTAGQLAALGLTLVGGSVAFSAIGLLIGSRVGGRSAPAFVNVLYLPMIYLSGFLIPLPTSFDRISHLSPAYHLDRLALFAVGASTADPTPHIVVLVGVTLAFGAMAIRRLGRNE